MTTDVVISIKVVRNPRKNAANDKKYIATMVRHKVGRQHIVGYGRFAGVALNNLIAAYRGDK